MAAVATVLVWTAEYFAVRYTPGQCNVSLKCLALGPCFVWSLIPPMNFMENRKGSFVVASMYGALVAMIFLELVNPTKDSWINAMLWVGYVYTVPRTIL